MRAGCFAEDRVIKLMDRRFVSYYFNRSGNGEGGNEAATKFVNGQTDNPYAYFAAFKPTGELVGETEIYADKDAVMQWLQNLLRRYPEYAKPTGAESGVLAAGGLAAAQLAENLADYAKAKAGYDGLLESEDVGVRTAALLGLLRIYRYQEDWDQHEVVQKLLRWAVEGGADKSLLVDLSVEKGYRLIASNKFAEARSVLQALAFRAKDSSRLAEAHFLAGRACWFVDDHDWAKFHWCWIVDNLPEDRLYMRARIAAAAEGMPYPNAELDGFAAKVGNIGTHSIVTAVAAAKEVYRQLQPSFEAKKFTAELQEIVAAAPALDAKVGKIGQLAAAGQQTSRRQRIRACQQPHCRHVGEGWCGGDPIASGGDRRCCLSRAWLFGVGVDAGAESRRHRA